MKRTNNLEENDADEIPDDEMINKFISRDEQEFERFGEMDEERYVKEKEIFPNFMDAQDDKKTINYRLMDES